MDPMVGALRQLFNRLQRKQDSVWLREPLKGGVSARALQARDRLIESCPPLSVLDFERCFPASSVELHVNFSKSRRFLYLPPLEKDAEFVPVLFMKCDIDDSKAEMHLRVMLVRFVEDHEAPDHAKLCGIGFRLDTPHDGSEAEGEAEETGAKKEPSHGFHHAQLIRDLDGAAPIECPDWIPCTQPSFPLPAECPVTLVLCLLLALYGKGYCWDFISNDARFFDWLKKYVDRIQPWIKWKALA